MCLMNTVLKKFVNESLFDASEALLHHLHIVFNEVTRVPVPFENLYPLDLSKALQRGDCQSGKHLFHRYCG